MFEAAYYEYAVIEKFLPGMIPIGKQMGWFKAVYGENCWDGPVVTEIEKPEWAKGAFNFGLG